MRSRSSSRGWATSVRETLTEKHMETGPMPPTRAVPPRGGDAADRDARDAWDRQFPAARVAVLHSGWREQEPEPQRTICGADSRSAGVSRFKRQEKLETSYTADAISLSWPGQPEDIAPAQAAPQLRRHLPVAAASGKSQPGDSRELTRFTPPSRRPGTADAPWPGAAPALEARTPPPTPRFGYNVYETVASASASAGATAPVEPDAPSAPGPIAPIAPLNAALLTAPAFNDAARGVRHRAVLRRASRRNGRDDADRERGLAADVRDARRHVRARALRRRW